MKQELTTKQTEVQKNSQQLQVGTYLSYHDEEIYKVVKREENLKCPEDPFWLLQKVDPETGELTSREPEKRLESNINEYYKRMTLDMNSIREKAQRLLLEGWKDDFKESEETALMSLGNKESLMAIREDIAEKRLMAQMTQKWAKAIVKKQMDALERKIAEVNEAIRKMNKEVEKLDYVIQTIETYAGIKEQVRMLVAGEPATEETPIVFRQAVIFLDEEMALIEDDFDYTKMKNFEEWLLNEEHYKQLLPDSKSMVAVVPRRTKKEYSDNPWENWVMNQPNFEVRFLIRNGDRLYSLESEHIILKDRMFPSQNEYAKLIEEEQKDHWYQYHKENDQLKSTVFRKTFTKVMFLMQGLLDRSDVFSPHHFTGSLINMQGFSEDEIVLNYELDMSKALGDGRKDVLQWINENNAKLSEGKRVIVIPYSRWGFQKGYEFYKGDFVRYYEHNREPNYPNTGIYTLYRLKPEERKNLYGTANVEENYLYKIMYIPEDEIYTEEDGFRKRKNRVSIVINTHRGGLLNYDDVEMEEVEYYLNSRLHRSQYYWFVQILKWFKDYYHHEKGHEEEYVKMCVGRLMSMGYAAKGNMTMEEPVIMAIEKVKGRLKWKRPITSKEKETYTLVTRTLFSKEYLKKYYQKSCLTTNAHTAECSS